MCIFASVADSSDIFQAFYLEEKWPNANAGQTEAQIGMEYDIVRRQVRFNNSHYKERNNSEIIMVIIKH